MSINWDVIVFFPIYDQYATSCKPPPGCMVYKTDIFTNNNVIL